MNIPDCAPPLREILIRLLAEADLTISQHDLTPDPAEWYGGDWGPYTSAEEALVQGVKWLRGLYDQADQERNALLEENRHLRIALAALQQERRHEA